MGRIVLVTGGARSGKSNFAETYVKGLSEKVTYIATAIPFDDEMKERIAKHQSDRPSHWGTLEAYSNLDVQIAAIDGSSDVALLDCVTVMAANLMFEKRMDDYDGLTRAERAELETYVTEAFEALVKEVLKSKLTLVCVTNEIGMGIVPDNAMTRLYRDIAGRVNQYLAAKAEEVHFVVSGIPIRIK